MIRPTKFRGKTGAGKWLYGDLITTPFKDCCYILDVSNIEYYDCFEHIAEHMDDLEVTPDSVGRFTELQDINGVDIYEGDIVKHPDFAKKYSLLIGFKNGFYHGSNWGFERTDFTCSTVIGNTTDTPDLLP